jgi:hypothetical protein
MSKFTEIVAILFKDVEDHLTLTEPIKLAIISNTDIKPN